MLGVRFRLAGALGLALAAVLPAAGAESQAGDGGVALGDVDAGAGEIAPVSETRDGGGIDGGVEPPRVDAGAADGGGSAVTLPGSADAGPPPGSYNFTETFERFPPGLPPEGFLFRRTGKGGPARWTVREADRAPSPTHVLAQVDADRAEPRFPLALFDNFSVRDVRVSTRCRVLGGRGERSCGVVAREKSEKAYYLARVSVRDANLCLQVVDEGADKQPRRRDLACAPVPVPAGRWVSLALGVRRHRLEVFFGGKWVFGLDDRTYPDAARVGLWTGNDSVAEFDDARADNL